MLPSPKKHISNYQQILAKKFACTSRQSMCIRVVLRKKRYFCGQCQKDKTSLTKALLLALNFVFFTQPKRQTDFSCKDFACT
jgi:hypothetical protein